MVTKILFFSAPGYANNRWALKYASRSIKKGVF